MIVKQHFFYFYNFFAIPFLWDPCFTQGIPRFRIFHHSIIPTLLNFRYLERRELKCVSSIELMGYSPTPSPPKKNTTTTEALRNVRSKLNQNRNYIVTDRHPLTHSCPFHGGFASYQKRGSSHKNGSKQKNC